VNDDPVLVVFRAVVGAHAMDWLILEMTPGIVLSNEYLEA
jgi:hypothetical protein